MTMSLELAYRFASEPIALYRAKRASPVEVARACLSPGEALNPNLNALCIVDAEGAPRAAR